MIQITRRTTNPYMERAFAHLYQPENLWPWVALPL